MLRNGHENGPFWMLAGAVLVLFFFHWGRFGRGRFGLRGPFSTFIGAVLAMGRFGRFPIKSLILLKKLIFISNFNVLVLMFVFCFFLF